MLKLPSYNKSRLQVCLLKYFCMTNLFSSLQKEMQCYIKITQPSEINRLTMYADIFTCMQKQTLFIALILEVYFSYLSGQLTPVGQNFILLCLYLRSIMNLLKSIGFSTQSRYLHKNRRWL